MGQKTNPKAVRASFIQQNFFFKSKRYNTFIRNLNNAFFEHSLISNKTQAGEKTFVFFLLHNLLSFYATKLFCIINNVNVVECNFTTFIYVEIFKIKSNVYNLNYFFSFFQKHLEATVNKQKPLKIFFIVINNFFNPDFEMNTFLKKKTTKSLFGINQLYSLGFICNFFPGAVAFSRIVALVLEKNIKHSVVLESINQLFDFLFQLKTSNFRGIKLQVSGRINGVDMAKKQLILYGSIPLQTVNTFINYSYATANTPFGVCGLKVWFSYYKYE